MRIRLGPPNRLLAARLDTARFSLLPLGALETIRLTAPLRRDPEMLRAIGPSTKPLSLLAWIRRSPVPDNAHRFVFAIVPRDTARPIGVHTVRFAGHRSMSCGVMLFDRDWWGKNVVLEARACLINHFFAHAAIDRFEGTVFGRNTASFFNYQRLGFRHVGTWRRQRPDSATGELLDVSMFELLRADWEAGPHAGSAP